jgi:hypothetical protein
VRAALCRAVQAVVRTLLDAHAIFIKPAAAKKAAPSLDPNHPLPVGPRTHTAKSTSVTFASMFPSALAPP